MTWQGRVPRRPPRRERCLLALSLLAAAGCRPRAGLPLEVEVAGCELLLRGPVCVVAEDGRVTLWVRTTPRARLELGGEAEAIGEPTLVQGGRRLLARVPSPGGELRLRAREEGGVAEYRLRLAPRGPRSALEEARSLRRAGKLAETRARLERELAGAPAAERAHRLGVLARLELSAGAVEPALERLQQAARLHHQAGCISEAVSDATALAYTLIYNGHRFVRARAILEEARLWSAEARFGPAEFYLAYASGSLAGRVGDYRRALGLLEAASQQAARLGLGREERLARQVYAMHLQSLGRGEEARRLLDEEWRALPAAATPCERADLLHKRAWSTLVALEGGAAIESPLALLEQARALYDGPCTGAPAERVNVRLNLAIAALHAGRAEQALAWMAAARRLELSRDVRFLLWERDLVGRLALRDGRTDDALEAYLGLEELAQGVMDTEARWRALVGAARAHAAAGEREAASAALARAEALLDQASWQVALGQGRTTFVAQRQHASELQVELLLERGEAALALDVVRRARRRALQAIWRADQLAQLPADRRAAWDRLMADYHARRDALNAALADAWRRPADELRLLLQEQEEQRRQLRRVLDEAAQLLGGRGGRAGPLRRPAEGELLLAYFPMGPRWAAFAADRTRTLHRWLTPPSAAADAASLGASLLEPLAASLAGRRRVIVLTYGAANRLDVHALPVGGRPLGELSEVVYGLDLEQAVPPARLAAQGAARRALVVIDPRSNLPALHQATATVRRALAGELTLLERATASSAAVRRALAGAELFHYAGHGSFGGPDGFESALLLAGGGELWVSDVLALPRAPRWAVLLGCDTGKSDDAAGPSLGLAQAFVAAGSELAVAAARPLDAEVAAILSQELYAQSRGGAPLDLAAAVHALRARLPAADWSSLRAYVP